MPGLTPLHVLWALSSQSQAHLLEALMGLVPEVQEARSGGTHLGARFVSTESAAPNGERPCLLWFLGLRGVKHC